MHLALVGVISDYIVLVVATYHPDKDQTMTCTLYISFELGDRFVYNAYKGKKPKLPCTVQVLPTFYRVTI